jgi:hypothetical protein
MELEKSSLRLSELKFINNGNIIFLLDRNKINYACIEEKDTRKNNLPFSGTYLLLIVPIEGQNMPTHISNTINATNIKSCLYEKKCIKCINNFDIVLFVLFLNVYFRK